ncbi:MAG: pyridoxamine 5'-phosphate oxidase [Chloroflexaceae bacterium]|nr:pyridoxamine 5'-phosphate oxidase [Chloroflexaceae bacterium]NJO06062.1 pyridoxamine 5'-phosphate oxidase [Chloroflexaceae bacterium]
MVFPPPEVLPRLTTTQTIWLATVRPDGRPHLAPLWFVWVSDAIHICVQPASVKVRNIAAMPQVSIALIDSGPNTLCEGIAATVPAPWPATVREAFWQKYEWQIDTDQEYTLLLAITPTRWKEL